MTNNKKIKLFASSILVKGANRSLICDLQRETYLFILNDLYEILHKYEGETLKTIKKKYNNKYDSIIEEYFNFLFQKEHIFYTDLPHLFPKLNLHWFEPFKINNAIIDLDEKFDFENVLSQLNQLRCKSIEFRFFNHFSTKVFFDILLFLDIKKSILSSLGFVIPYSSETTQNKLKNIIKNNPRISYFIITNAPKDMIIKKLMDSNAYIIYTSQLIKSSYNCGIISKDYFAVNMKQFTESQNHNTCLNRKISIDIDGEIKNCPSMSTSFGNIRNTTLEEALNHPEFKKHWNINKDQINVCKDCEFRHICTDCRAFIEEPNNIYSKPLKCGYNPYTNEWSEWSTNPLKQKAIEYYSMQELIKKDA